LLNQLLTSLRPPAASSHLFQLRIGKLAFRRSGPRQYERHIRAAPSTNRTVKFSGMGASVTLPIAALGLLRASVRNCASVVERSTILLIVC